MNKNTDDKTKKSDRELEGDEKHRQKKKPRGALFDSGDPTLARKLADDPFGLKR